MILGQDVIQIKSQNCLRTRAQERGRGGVPAHSINAPHLYTHTIDSCSKSRERKRGVEFSVLGRKRALFCFR